jgi:hypothetical protein
MLHMAAYTFGLHIIEEVVFGTLVFVSIEVLKEVRTHG